MLKKNAPFHFRIILTLFFTLAAALSGCQGGGGGGGDSPSPSGTSLSFSHIAPMKTGIGSSIEQNITLTNTGEQTATIVTFSTLKLPLALKANTCNGKSLGPQKSCTFVVSFTPADTQAGSQNLTVNYADPTGAKSAVATILYQGLGNANLSFNPIPPIKANVGGATEQPVTIKNDGESPASQLVLSTEPPLKIKRDATDGCSGKPLNRHQTCSFILVFTPVDASGDTKPLNLSYNDTSTGKNNSTIAYVPYQGFNSPLGFSPSPIAPMSAPVDSTSQQTITVTNLRPDYSINQIQIQSLAAPLSILPDIDNPHSCQGKTLAGNESCTFTVLFSPIDTTSGSQDITLTYYDTAVAQSGSSLLPISYQGVGTSNLSFSPIGPMTTFVSSEIIQTITVSNNGVNDANDIHFNSLAPPLYIVQNNCSGTPLTRGASCQIQVKLTNENIANDTQNIVMSYDGSKTVQGAIPYQVVRSDTENFLTFQSIQKSMTAAPNAPVTQTVTIQNRGSSSVSLKSFLPLPINSPLKIILGNCANTTLVSGGTCTFSIRFNPQKSMPLSRDLIGITYVKSDPNQPVALSQYVGYETPDQVDPSEIYVPNETLGVFNNCSEPIWIQLKPVGGKSPIPNADLIKIAPNSSQDYKIDEAGMPSLNLWAKQGCDANGIHCLMGQSADTCKMPNPNPGPKDPPCLSDCSGTQGCQPSIDSLFESTFGCSLADRSACNKNPSDGTPLTPINFFDPSFVDGYTLPISVRVIPGENEDNVACLSVTTPKLDFDAFTDCPSAENLTALTSTWEINENANQSNWDWDTIRQNQIGNIVNPFWGKDLQAGIIGINDKDAWNNALASLKRSSQLTPSYGTKFQCYDLINNKNLTDISLQSVDLRFKADGKPFGCASPKTMMTANRRWGGLGIGNQCTELREQPGTNNPYPSTNENYIDPSLYYSNPITDNGLLGDPSRDVNKNTNPTWGARWPNLSDLCPSNNTFCKKNPGDATARGGIAAIVGHAGPVYKTQYVQNIKKSSSHVYAWQYDDAAGTRVCNKRPKIVVTFCKK